MLRSERERLGRILKARMESLPGYEESWCGVCWGCLIDTKAGRLRISYDVDDGAIRASFEDPCFASSVIGCNHMTGNWLFLGEFASVEIALYTFQRNLDHVLFDRIEPVVMVATAAPIGGTFTLTRSDGSTTHSLPWNASGSEIQKAIEDLMDRE